MPTELGISREKKREGGEGRERKVHLFVEVINKKRPFNVTWSRRDGIMVKDCVKVLDLME